MQQNYQDVIAIFRHVDKRSDFFITMTCNPNWEEFKVIFKNFPPRTRVNNVPKLAVRLLRFYLKFCSLLYDIVNKRVIPYAAIIEFQKRGLLHGHILITLHPEDFLKTPELIDKLFQPKFQNSI